MDYKMVQLKSNERGFVKLIGDAIILNESFSIRVVGGKRVFFRSSLFEFFNDYYKKGTSRKKHSWKFLLCQLMSPIIWSLIFMAENKGYRLEYEIKNNEIIIVGQPSLTTPQEILPNN